MATIRPNAEPAATSVLSGDIFLIDGATGVRALAASVVPLLDVNANASINNVIEGFTSTATAAGTTVLTVTSTAQQFFTGTLAQTVTLPVVSGFAKPGASYFFQNSSTGALTVQSSGANVVKVIGPGAFAIVTCIAITGTTAASWQATYFADIVVSGKVLTLNNSLTLSGTDGTTQTFPATSATLARTDAGQTFTGTQAFGALTATTLNGNTFTAGTGVLTIAAAKTLTASNSLTLTATDGSTAAFGAGGTVAYQGGTLAQFAATTSAQLAGILSDETGTGSAVFANAPTLVNPVVGTQTAGNNTTLAASTAFVTAAVAGGVAGVSSLNGATGALVNSVATRTALAAVDTTKNTSVTLSEAGREGLFIWEPGDHSVLSTGDPLQGVCVAASAIATTAGAWVRLHTEGVYDVRWFGAKGDGSTNDAPAIQAAINLASIVLPNRVLPGGTVKFSLGFYRITTGLTISSMYIRLEGVGMSRSVVFTDQPSVTVMTFSAQRCALSNMSVWITVATTTNLLLLTSGCVQCVFQDLDLVGGAHCYAAVSTGLVVDNVVTNVSMQQAFGGSSVFIQGAGTQHFYRCLFNQTWPAGVPANSNDKGTRANTTAYSVKDFVAYAGFYLQCTVAGTSASVGPTPAGIYYGINFVDGGVTWRLAGLSNGFAVTLDTGAAFIRFEDCDMTGPYNFGANLSNTLAGVAPDEINFTRCTSGGTVAGGFFIGATRRTIIRDCEVEAILGSLATTRIGYCLQHAGGDVLLDGNSVISNVTDGVFLGHTGSATVTNSRIFGCTVGIFIAAGCSNNQIIGNNVGSSPVFGANTVSIQFAAGASDFYWNVNNRITGSGAINNAATGTNFVISGNI